MELNICHLYPDVMNLSGDRGNLLCMEKRLQWRGIKSTVTKVGISDAISASDYDLIFIGNGQPFEQHTLLDDLYGEKAQQIKSAIEDGLPVLAICGGYQLLGNTYESADGRVFEGVGALNVYTKCAGNRIVGDYLISCDAPFTELVGFENHIGKTWLLDDVRPLGTTTIGHGNNGEDQMEGARYKNVFASYAHGCLLPKNPALCDEILRIALERKYGQNDLPLLNDIYEMAAHDYMVNRLS